MENHTGLVANSSSKSAVLYNEISLALPLNSVMGTNTHSLHPLRPHHSQKTKTSGVAYRRRIQRDMKVLELLGYYHWYRRHEQLGHPVKGNSTGKHMTRLANRARISPSELTAPWERRGDPFKAYWISHAIADKGFRWYSLTLRLGDNQIERCSQSPHGFLRSYARRLNLALDSNVNPFWLALELTARDGAWSPHFHGLIGIPRVAGTASQDHAAEARLNGLLYKTVGDFYRPKAIDLKRVYQLTGWIGYCSKHSASAFCSTKRTPYYFPQALLQSGREHYNTFREVVSQSVSI